MSRWLFLVSCLGVLAAVGRAEPARHQDARGLGGLCEGTVDCHERLACASVDGVLDGQCSAVCNSDAACEEAFGAPAMCVGADRCVRSCGPGGHCPVGTLCNGFGWCERMPARP